MIDRELYLPKSWTAGPAHQGPGLYRCYAPRPVPLATWSRSPGADGPSRNFQAGKGLAGLEEHQVRTWTSWHRWVTLAMLACAFLTIAAAAEHTRQPPPPEQIRLTRNEVARLFAP